MGKCSHAFLSVKNKEFTHRVIEHHRRENVGDKGVGSEKAEAFDEESHEHRAKEGAHTRNRVKEKDLNDDRVFPALKDKENIGDISHHVGNEKGDEVADHRVASSGSVVYSSDGQLEEPNCMILLLQRGEDLPGYEMENDNMGNCGKTTGQSVFNELKDRWVIEVHVYCFRWRTIGVDGADFEKVVVYTRL